MPQTIEFPFPTPPKPAELLEVSPGIFWIRLALPFRLNHINVYLIEDGEGFALVDTGLDDEATRDMWLALFRGPLQGRRLTRIISTHYHPDHMGLAGWLCERCDIGLLTSETEYLVALSLMLDPSKLNSEPYVSFYRSHGLNEEITEIFLSRGLQYLRMMSPLPRTFRRLIAGETLTIGDRAFDVLTGGGHSPEQVMLHCAADDVLLCGDQVLAHISPNISVEAMDPDGDPLGIYLRSLRQLKQGLPEKVLALPSHNLPFVGLHERAEQLIAHHEGRCAAILQACATAPMTAGELVPVVFGRAIEDPHQMTFAFGEALAHANYLVRRNEISVVTTPEGMAFGRQ